MDNAHCLICKSIREIESKRNPYVLKACKTGYAVLGWHQYYEGYTLFLCKKHVFELHELVEPCRTTFLQEMATLAEAVYRAFKPVKLNYELLGNTDRHLHWHLIPRYTHDPNPTQPVWSIDKQIREGEHTRPSAEKLRVLKTKILRELTHLEQLPRQI